MRTYLVFLIAVTSSSAFALDCSPTATAQPTPTVALPVAPGPGLDGRFDAVADHAVFGEQADDLAVAAVLERQRLARCASTVTAASGYVKQTEFDNTPYRFNMKPGQKLTAEEFDAWMQARGIRIVKAKATTPTPADAGSAPVTTPVSASATTAPVVAE